MAMSMIQACKEQSSSVKKLPDAFSYSEAMDATNPSDTGNNSSSTDDAGPERDAGEPPLAKYTHPDRNNDGQINILVLGTSSSLDGGRGFSSEKITVELTRILEGDSAIIEDVNILPEDIYTKAPITFGLGGNGAEYTVNHHRHSLTQYLYWPEDADIRSENLKSNREFTWDYVVIGADPYIVANMPGYYALGAHKIATKAAEGGAQPLLLMMWSDDSSQISLFEKFVYRTAKGAPTPLPVVPAGLAWNALPIDQQDDSSEQPTPIGAYLAAAATYSQITQVSASKSSYTYSKSLADLALITVNEAKNAQHFSDDFSFDSPFAAANVETSTVTYNHTGTSSERGILNGLKWIFGQATETLQNGTASPMTFNYGRANTNFEPNKRYQIDAARFQYSFGFPMQDHGNHGDISMLYGLDSRDGGIINDTDLGVARFMIEQSELPFARAIPIRTLYAQMKESSPNQSAYRDAWHMHRNLDKSIGAYIYTILTNKCALGIEPSDSATSEWKTWKAHKVGCDTAWTLMYLETSPF